LLSHSQNNITNLTQWNLDRYVTDCLKELKIDSIILVIVPQNELIKGKYQGLMIRNNTNMFSVMLYHYLNYNDACLILSHELVHIHQMLIGSLNVSETNTIDFKGRTYKANTDNEILNPHEVEAHKIGLQLYGKFKRVVYSPPPLANKSF
jgi:hypothetical protein